MQSYNNAVDVWFSAPSSRACITIIVQNGMTAMNTEEFMIKLNNQELLCPDCKSKLEMADMIMWD